MATRRMIWPDFWDDEDVLSLPLAGRLLFVAMFSLADDEGREKTSTAKWKRRVFSGDDLTLPAIEELLSFLDRKRGGGPGLIILYESGGDALYQCTKWWRYQSIQYPKASNFPPPPNYRTERVETGGRPMKDATRKQKSMIENRCAELGLDAFAFLRANGMPPIDTLKSREVPLVVQKLDRSSLSAKRSPSEAMGEQLTFAVRADDLDLVRHLLAGLTPSGKGWPDVRSKVLVDLGYDPTQTFIASTEQFTTFLVAEGLLTER